MRVFNRPGASRGRSTGKNMRQLALAGAAALCLTACGDGSMDRSAAGQADAIEAQAAAAEAPPLDQAAIDADNRRKLDEIGAAPDLAYEPPTDERWFMILPDGRNCAEVRMLFQASTPYEAVDELASAGRRFHQISDKPGMVMFREGVGPDSKFLAFVMGEDMCILAARTSLAQAQG